MRSNVNRATSDIQSREDKLDQIEDDLVRKGAALIADETSSEDRIILLADTSQKGSSLEQLLKDVLRSSTFPEVRTLNSSACPKVLPRSV